MYKIEGGGGKKVLYLGRTLYFSNVLYFICSLKLYSTCILCTYVLIIFKIYRYGYQKMCLKPLNTIKHINLNIELFVFI